MTDDIVKRLLSQIGDDVQKIYDKEALFRQAAAEITALRAEVERLTAQANDEHEWRMDVEAKLFIEESARIAAEAERDALRVEVDGALKENGEMVLEALAALGQAQDAYEAQRAAEAERDRLREALEPLRRIADAFDANELDDEARKFWGQHSVNTTPHEDIELYQGRGGKQLLTLADCMFARAALILAALTTKGEAK